MVKGVGDLTVTVTNLKSQTSSERDQGSRLKPGRRRIPTYCTWRLPAPGSKPFPLGPGTEPLSCKDTALALGRLPRA